MWLLYDDLPQLPRLHDQTAKIKDGPMTDCKVRKIDFNFDNYEFAHGILDGPLKAPLDKVFADYMTEVVPKSFGDMSCKLSDIDDKKTLLELKIGSGYLAEYIVCTVDFAAMVSEKIEDILEVGDSGGLSQIEWMELHESNIRCQADKLLDALNKLRGK
jgi:hypothetical protein